MAGAPYRAIALLLDVRQPRVRYHCRRAIKTGLATSAQLRHKPTEKPKRISEADYPAHWIASVMKRCIVDSNGCWLWQGFKNVKGYGRRDWRNKGVFIHRQMFMLANGIKSLKTEQAVCHRCDVRNCCNPDHLWLGDAAANVLDSAIKKRHRNARKTHCLRGHPLSGGNLEIHGSGLRRCKICQRGRYRLRSGWPQELAFTERLVPAGYSREVLK